MTRYRYSFIYYSESGSSHTAVGIIEIADRPMIGEQVWVNEQWMKIIGIRHFPEGLELVLENEEPPR